ncbi:MAG: nitrate reductase associated protein [Cyclobacteriaceae bacterium]
MYFKFEKDFVGENVRCIPMIVRFKLDACGIKLKLAEWSRMTPAEREHFATESCQTPEEATRYGEDLRQLIYERTGNSVAEISIEPNPAWSRTDEIPYSIREMLAGSPWSLSLQQWQQFTDLQRFALVKLSYPGHENKNFPKAMAEFPGGNEE